MLKLTLLALLLLLTACKQRRAAEVAEKKDPNFGKRLLQPSDPRRLDTYLMLLLVAVKYKVGVDTAAQIISAFDKRFSYKHITDGRLNSFPFSVGRNYEEDAQPIRNDVLFFSKQGEKFRLYPSVVADVVYSFYSLMGSNRYYPEPQGQ
ncbi:hypothetical protein [Hymenobacter sp. BRD67]|uniref:hypothetical protein n=1 Tax=Hymenobacter sp. BRD67 TaxID=2675877 RepID=UPI001566A45D|nr:hypothetical protein [Hymenobacter sp. BRD67]QKG54383.1 hypothetical protein GKZ67_19480 [Hymenobacter sp. BRD67]